MSPRLSIVIPCYNEEKSIPLILTRFQECISDNNIEVVLVNNGSTDGSKKVFASLIPNYPWATLVTVEKNQGYGYGILQGLQQATGNYLGWTHADLQTDPHDVIKAFKLIQSENGETYIKGLRKGRPLFDSFFTWGMSIFESLYFKTPIYDINAQPNIFPKEFYLNWLNPPHDFSLDLYAYYYAKHLKLKIIRFDVIFPKRIHGFSTWNTGIQSRIKFIKRTLLFSFQLKKELRHGIHRPQS